MKLTSLKDIILSGLFPILCFIAAFIVLFFHPFFTYFLFYIIGKPQNIFPTLGFIKHVFGIGSIPAIFNSAENSHLSDVAWLIRGLICFFILFLTLFLKFVGKNKAHIIKYGFYSLTLIIATVFLMPYDFTFRLFHEVFFPNGNWTFLGDSVIIQLFPYEFFFYYAVFIVILALFFGFLIYFINKRRK